MRETIQNYLEVEFLKTKSYHQINDMFNEINTKLKDSQKENAELQEKLKAQVYCGCSITEE